MSPSRVPGRRGRIALAVGVATLCVALATVRSARAATHRGPAKHEVLMRAISFSPVELVVAVGDTVEWRNADIVRHNAVRPELFATGDLKPGERGTWVPTDTGTFGYQCTIHSRMRGKVVVR